MTEINYREEVKKHGGMRKAAKELGIPYGTFWDRLKREELNSLFTSKSLDPATLHTFPEEGSKPKYFILTSAQDSSKIHKGFFANLLAYSAHLDAQLIVGGYTYNKSLFEDHAKRSGIFHPSILPYMAWGRVELGDISFCGEMNTSPTAVSPLSGFETYTKDKWGIFPHPKVQMVSVPTHKEDKPKLLFTTGSVTVPNYVPKKAGIKAQFHHVIGAMVVELADDHSAFCRHLLADEDGSFYDLDTKVENETITTGHAAEALNYGDIHHEKLDPKVAMATWGYDVRSSTTTSSVSLVDFLRPKHQFFHDLSDFDPRNHHNIQDIHFRFARHHNGSNNVRSALAGCSTFLKETFRPYSKSVVVQSNHDNALVKWLKTADYRADPENALFFLEAQTEFYNDLYLGIKNPRIFENTLRRLDDIDGLGIHFNDEDETYKICGIIECGMHGHLGANGARATPQQFTKMGSKVNLGHAHSASITDGVYVAGVSAKLDLGYNRGLSSWSHSHIVTYANGKRAILTMSNGRWFA